ncbi:putative lipoprotein [Pseudomonas savastanoi pv. glycinea]|nr:putative lipoprotein [Pseudomonas savastanoi pv. glycinea]
MIRALLIACVLLLAACASKAPLPVSVPELQLPMQLHIQRQQAEQRQDWLLVIQQEASGLRWSLMDPLGIPLARQQLINGQWQADGLLPPNAEARELFASLLFALTPDNQLRRNYPTAQRRGTQRILDERWGVEYSSADTFRLIILTGKDGRINYAISPLNSEALQ